MSKTETKTESDESLAAVVLMTLFIVLIVSAYKYDHPDNKNPKLNIVHFKKGKDLICQTSLGGRASILVNKQSGYLLYRAKYFKKDNELVDIKYCTQIKKKEK